jgi:predicted DNA-binding transcriptional regulator YafY
MPVNKNQSLRLHVILELLRKNTYPNYSRFMAEMKRRDPAGEYNLSDKTFLRDIDVLRTVYNAPVEYEATEHGFFLSDREWFSKDLLVEPFKMKNAVLGQMAAQSLMPEPLRSEINEAVQALLTRNETGFSDLAELDMMQVINPVQLPLSPKIFCTVFKAWEHRHQLRLSYSTAKGKESDKIFEPHVIAWQAGVWYLKGRLVGTPKYSYGKPYNTILALHRISAAEMTDKSFASDRQLLNGINDGKLFNFPRMPEVRLLVQPDFAKPVRERYANKPECLEAQKDGSLRLTLHDVAEHEAVDLIFWARGQVKVISPDSLRQTIIDIAETVLRLQS